MKANYHIAIQAAVNAGSAILKVYGEEDFGIEAKEDDSPLTLADRKSHEVIAAALGGTGIPVLSEEGKNVPYSKRRRWPVFWLVDPLDGTKEFIKRNGEFTVNIALVAAGKAEFGVVYAPAVKELYLGIPEVGAFLCRKEEDFRRSLEGLLRSAEQLPGGRSDDDFFRVVASRSHFNEETEAFVHALGRGGKEILLVSKGSSLKLFMVAAGEADVYPRLGPTMEWDTAAAHAVVKAAGKNVYGRESGEELEYNKENLLNPFFVAR